MKKFILKQILLFFFRMSYILGLTTIIPFVFFGYNIRSAFQFFIFGFSIFLIGFSCIGIIRIKKEKGLISIGLITLIPACISLVFSIGGRELFFLFAEKYIIGFSRLEPLVINYLNKTIPKVYAITFIYFFIGLFFIFIKKKL